MAEDPRQVRTRVALTGALLELLEAKTFVSISVSQLCEVAGVHRTTFYKHAGSIEEFAVDVITRELDAIATVAADGDNPLGEYRSAMVDVLEHVASERTLYRPLLVSKWGAALRTAIDQRMQPRVRIALDVFAAQGDVTVPDHREEIVAFISGGLVGTIVAWALSDDTDAVAWATRVQALMPVWWPVR
ncbi:MAG: TetR/AcrR family transcriptional regulator [Corynebacterium humireducens]|uniref:TetR/AcrR family transcriptional regulator n=1 Tax=Corynebacterium humireducens TaxID=1223514 RepID=A0A7X6PQC5_9CORY|nr:TetR/AcrR family transcriptional regulator [Corynebacterium humireducens]NLB47084.1 TetR/AcrR family transcriptional regulator [Microbacteriaceae bacterium]